MDTNVFDTDSEDEIPAGWEERVTDEGKVYYASHSSKNTQWDHPVSGKRKKVAGELPYGWERKTDDSEQVYFIDHLNKRTTYTDPRLAFAEEDNKNGHEVRQRFDACSTALQVLQGRDLSGYYAIITGGNSGLGFETARSLALHGAHVVLACRNLKRAKEAVNIIKGERSMALVEAMHLDLACLKTVEQFAKNYCSKDWGLHMLILNAGVFSLPYTVTEDGYEATFQTNYLGHFYLTQLLTPMLIKYKHSRVVVVSSESHRFTDLTPSRLTEAQLSPPYESYRPILAYNQSKMCCTLFGLELHRRLAPNGIVCNIVHPGNVIYTGLARHWWMWKLLFTFVRPFSKNKQQGAATSVYCATAKELQRSGGHYFNNCFKGEPAEMAQNEELAKTLWEFSDILVLKAASLNPHQVKENII